MALILILVAVVAFSAVRLFGFQVGEMWQDVARAQGAVYRPGPSDGGSNSGNTGGGGSGLPGGGPEETTTTTTTTTTTAP